MPNLPKLTPFGEHVRQWKECRLCELCEGRRNVVMARGSVPADIVFVGEAPGESENVLGQPFKGPAGHLIDSIIRRTVPSNLRVALTNLVCCIPRDDDGKKIAEPPDAAIKACEPRLVQFVRIAQPKLIVTVGKLAQKYIPGEAMFFEGDDSHLPWLTPNEFLGFADITHPAAILRAPIAQRGLMIQRSMATLRYAVEEYFPQKTM